MSCPVVDSSQIHQMIVFESLHRTGELLLKTQEPSQIVLVTKIVDWLHDVVANRTQSIVDSVV